MDQDKFMEAPEVKQLQRCLRREHKLKLAAAAGLLLMGLSFVSLFFQGYIILTVFGLICTVLGLRFMAKLLRVQHTEEHRLFRLLQHQPKQIVWVYSVVTEHLPFGFQINRHGTLYFKLADGDDISVSMPADALKRVSKFLNPVLPHASFGYTRDREQWYIASPLMLMQDEPGDENGSTIK